MAKRVVITFTEEYRNSDIDFEFADTFLFTGNGKKAIYEEPNGDRYIFAGQNFKYDHGLIDRGTITSLTIVDAEVGVIQRVTEFSADPRQLSGDDFTEFYTAFLQRTLLGRNLKVVGTDLDDQLGGNSKNDVVLGGKGDDLITGGAGQDRLTGGRDSDTFGFNPGDGKDVITDFDAVGGEGFQDFIDATYPGDVAIFRVGRNTVVNFGSGDTFTLLGVKPGQIDETDFI